MRLLVAALLTIAAPLAAHASPIAWTDASFDRLVADIKAKMLSEPPAAVQEAGRARAYARSRPPGPARDLMIATATWLTGEALTRTGELTSARPYVELATEQAGTIAPGSRLLADALLLRGSSRADHGEVAPAMSDLHAAHDLFQRLGDSRGRARAFAQIANLYYDANDWNNALRYFDQALQVYHADPGLAVSIYNGRGLAELELKQLEEASRAFAQALTIARDLKSPLLTATVLKNIARTRLASNHPGSAEGAIRESLALARGLAPPEFIHRQIALQAQVAWQQGDSARAAELVGRAFVGVNLARTSLADREAHQTAYNAFHALGRNDLALAHLTALKRLDDEATELARSNGAALMAARFDFANQELRIAKLKADDLRRSIDFERARARSQRTALLGGVGATLLVIVVLACALLAVRRSRDRVSAANVDLESTNTALGKALAAKTEFLATTSHEIRTPLNGILGMTQVMLADPKVDGTIRDRVSLVHGAGVAMRALVDDILDVAKMETGNLMVEERAFDLCRALSEATRMWEEQAHAKGLAFRVDLADCPAQIVGDPARLRQIVSNLLSNALKFTLAGSVVLRAGRSGDRYEVSVKDTGIGVPADRQEEIFESFRQADTTTTRRFGGTGLGLTICRNLARAMGGDVTIESEGGGGATFTLSLPLRVAAAEINEEAALRTDRLGVLVVDPNPITRAKLKALLDAAAGPAESVADLPAARALLGARGCRQVVIEDAALGNDAEMAVLARIAEKTPTLVLRRADGDDRSALLAMGVRVLDRPIARKALIAAVQAEANELGRPPIVTRSA